ncbi:MAG TPA: MBL fold metallo-hydrolase [Marmoricola sp.]|jgi:glyoxylase-like metal-dependent hydrolase (beta-lactamase superfamily II)|nr:MBL fold metallo-hydrolase [Marmoricola sp.]
MATTYTGTVSPGGTPDTRELQHLIITKLAVDPQMSNNCYVLRCRATDEQVLIDAADDAPKLLSLLGTAGATKVITTHQHWDHHRALADVTAATGAVVVAGEPDAAAITEQTGTPVDDAVEQGDLIEFGDIRLQVIRITGHTPGSICLLYDDPDGTPHLWTGDSLFPGGPGMTTNPTDFTSLMDDLEERVFGRLPDETWFYPGHGNDSTLGAERASIPEWRARGW